MADQLRPGIVSEAAADPAITGDSPEDQGMLTRQVTGMFTPPPGFHGRAVSWTAVVIITIAFIIGGFALVVGPTWWLFWVSAALAAVGGLLALATNIFEDWY
jgi:nitrate/nitrite transporter NarK